MPTTFRCPACGETFEADAPAPGIDHCELQQDLIFLDDFRLARRQTGAVQCLSNDDLPPQMAYWIPEPNHHQVQREIVVDQANHSFRWTIVERVER